MAVGQECRRAFHGDIEGFDMLMVPGAAMEPPKIISVGSNDFIRMWMLLYVPDVSLPAGRGPKGLPVAIQLIGRQGDDAHHLIRVKRVEELLQQRRGIA
jgi:Asp-tRNA(Asn)/Glu-tRNA(Gln) amidotransferase A subunit family amidase